MFGVTAGARTLASVFGAQAKKSTARVIRRSISKNNAEFGAFCAAVFAIAMSSRPVKRWLLARKHSRNRRLTRFRSCERFICFFASAKPSLGWHCSLAVLKSSRAATSVTQAPEKRLPATNTRLYSAGKSSRAWRGKLMHDLLVGTASRKLRTNCNA